MIKKNNLTNALSKKAKNKGVSYWDIQENKILYNKPNDLEKFEAYMKKCEERRNAQ